MVSARTAGLFFALLPFTVPQAAGQIPDPGDPGPVLSLHDVLAHVRSNNPGLTAVRLDAAGMRTMRAQVTAWPDPMVSVTGFAGGGRMQRGQLMVEQTVPWRDVLRARGRSADAKAREADAMSSVVELDLVLQATHAYVEAAGIGLKLSQLAHFREELIGFERAAAVQYEVGAGPQQAILRTQLEKNSVRRRELLMESRLATLKQVLRRLTGDALPPAWDPDELPHPEAPTRNSVLEPGNVDHRPEIRALDAMIERQQADLEVAERAFRPDLSARVTWMEGSIMRGGADAVGIGIGVRVPLWRSPRQAAVEERELRIRGTGARREDLQLEIATEASSLEIKLGAHSDVIDLIDSTLLPQAEATQQATAAAYTNGRADYLDLLEAERTLLDLRIERIDRIVLQHQDAASLRRLIGSESSIDPVESR